MPGSISVSEQTPGRWVARCKFRDQDGVTRPIRKHGPTKTGARNALNEAISDRQRAGRQRAGELTPGSTFADAAVLFLARVASRRADSTHALYEFHLRNTILPAIGALRLRECTVGRIDAFLAALESRYAANTRRKLRSIVSGVLQHAVLAEAIPHNPVRDLDRIEQSNGARKTKPRGLTIVERQRFLKWLDGSSDDEDERRKQLVAQRADLPDLVRYMLGTGLRIGEALASRPCDVNLAGIDLDVAGGRRTIPVVAMAGNMTWVKGKGLVRHEGKSASALRLIPLPNFTATMLRRRLSAELAPEDPLFPAAGRDGRLTFRYPANVRRSLRSVRDEVELGWMTPHTWRRTYATILDDEISFTDRMKADLLGQAKFLKDEYVSRGELHPEAAVVLDNALNPPTEAK
ncbi:tyrosine-type recombinase/integrase [Pseudonocardia sp. HH130629-09]|uniref:tyrosine-type recombinase/integrase n=1 Tax=Pseudonocardia sp. HH130629-09 TaxID=1641402 RepID=UPI0007619578|nr:site-specific integrase [Pseudonocardia sp. HH130629-09]